MTNERWQRLSDVSIKVLRDAGWFPGRNVFSTLRLPPGFVLLEPARRVLEEFGGLSAGEWGPGLDCARMGIDIDPMLAVGEDDRFADYSARIGSPLYPLGEAGGGDCFLAIDDKGRVFLLMDDLILFEGETFEVALDQIFNGKKGKVVDEYGLW
jgi:hypothetical protein